MCEEHQYRIYSTHVYVYTYRHIHLRGEANPKPSVLIDNVFVYRFMGLYMHHCVCNDIYTMMMMMIGIYLDTQIIIYS